MPPMWWKLIKIMLVLFALFATIVCINSEISKRREAEVEAAAAETNSSTADTMPFVSDHLFDIMRNRAKEHQEKEQQQLAAEDIEDRVRSLFQVHDGHGVMIFNTTTTNEAASFMPIPTDSLANESQSESQTESQSQPQSLSGAENKSKHYHQYQSLNHQQQSFKVQRSPDGKLNLVFNDPIVSLQSDTHNIPQTTQPQQPHQQSSPPQNPQQPQQRPRRPIPGTIVFPDSVDKSRQAQKQATIDTGDLRCADGFNQSRSFCTKVNNYPDLSGLKDILMSSRFAGLRIDQPVPTEFGLRINGDEQLCNSHVRYLYPKLGQKEDRTWQYIVNTDEFKQGILIEECDNDGKTCQFLDSFPNNYVPICKQHYVLRQLATINNVSSGQPEVTSEPFKIPSCCKCVIKSKFSLENNP
ncbi:protein spaetzle isoform X2 [Drosophila grimshawi]|uniref:protein spaetzle isoform X2 n=1 Tax=Drosophila grimshawi TaxID=7222 RepID=UPI000C86FF8B|nr:protein spaetzle isoform X2 [Drosophila grimshawi]